MDGASIISRSKLLLSRRPDLERIIVPPWYARLLATRDTQHVPLFAPCIVLVPRYFVQIRKSMARNKIAIPEAIIA
ncbi:hypothetical protein LAUMK4_01917 [Mycobacterium persicum]|uniref:Uncharacterized protein n=1 Tax=Mycobacterium persicum TaxID=1487726 RepID=A0ABY6RGH8_9MYCO|nr:hypothetical protein LAUMK4_01917 [Mycobacterium persicum]